MYLSRLIHVLLSRKPLELEKPTHSTPSDKVSASNQHEQIPPRQVLQANPQVFNLLLRWVEPTLDPMNSAPTRIASVACLLFHFAPLPLHAHDITTAYLMAQATPPGGAQELPPGQTSAASSSQPPTQAKAGAGRLTTLPRPPQAAAFDTFGPQVKTRWDERFLFIESNGMPAHNMMVGIKSWQQQVPLPQAYSGSNAWQIPLTPVPAKQPLSIKGRFLRGAVAIAANGIPIFNPQNNRGEVAAEIGELDKWGGHCGRADDYHYHVAPLHLQQVLGSKLPVAYALDGYPIYGLTEPDGSTPANLDAFNGHASNVLGYHYHASNRYPYINGGFHGEVVELNEQVDPQPRATPVREAGRALRGASITAFEKTASNSFKLAYELNGEKRAVLYAINTDGTVIFEFQNGKEGTTKQTYTQRQGGGGPGGNGGGERNGKGPRPGDSNPPNSQPPPPRPDEAGGGNARGPRRDAPPGNGPRKPWIQVHGAEIDANNDGVITFEEFMNEAKRTFDGYDRNHDGKLTRDEYTGPGGVRSPMGGFVKEHAAQIDVNGDGIITFEEFLAHLRPMFEKQDLNHDGKLTPEEWRDLPENPNQEPSQKRKERPQGNNPRTP
jgi:Ca2+-binding EF-hand superfamily protein